MEKLIYSTLYDVFAAAWQRVEAENRPEAALNHSEADVTVALREAA